MAKNSVKSMLKEIAQNAVYNQHEALYTSRVNDSIYTFMCSPDELVAHKWVSTSRETPVNRQDMAPAAKRQKALLWLWNHLDQWQAIDKAFQAISDKLKAYHKAQDELRDIPYSDYDRRQKVRERLEAMQKELNTYNKRNKFLDGFTIEYLHQTMPANWIKLAA